MAPAFVDINFKRASREHLALLLLFFSSRSDFVYACCWRNFHINFKILVFALNRLLEVANTDYASLHCREKKARRQVHQRIFGVGTRR